MRTPAKIMTLSSVSLMILAFSIAPASALSQHTVTFEPMAAIQPARTPAQHFITVGSSDETGSLDTLLALSEFGNSPHNYDVEAAIAQARAEIGTSRPTGWSMPGECIVSVNRWVEGAGGALWHKSGDGPAGSYVGATRLTIDYAQVGDIVQYEHLDYPNSWVSGVHTLFIVGVNADGTFHIIQSNVPGGSGLVTEETHWSPEPPAGFQTVVWRF